MTAHHFNDEADVTSGYFTDDYGRQLYKYSYDRESKTLTVETGNFGRTREMVGAGIDRMSEDELRDCLIKHAIEVGEDLITNPPIK